MDFSRKGETFGFFSALKFLYYMVDGNFYARLFMKKSFFVFVGAVYFAVFAAGLAAEVSAGFEAKSGTNAGGGEVANAKGESKANDDLQGPFVLVDESPVQVIKLLELLSGKTSLQAADLPNVKINFQSNGKFTRAEAIASLESLLSLNGIAITPLDGKFFRAAPAKSVNAQAPTFIVGRAADIKDNQKFYSKLYELKFLDTDSVKDALKTFITPNDIASIVYFPRSNAFLLTDTLSNQKRVEMLLEKIDTAAPVKEDIGFFTLKHTAAPDMKNRLTALQGDLLKKYFNQTVVEADERTNQIVVITQKGNLKRIAEIIEKLDVDAEPLTSSRVFYIKHGESKDVASVLNEIIRGQQTAAKNSKAARNAAANAQNRNNRNANYANRNNANAARLPTNLKADQTGAALQFSDYITIVADERSNSIVAYGTPTDLAQVESIITQVDVVLAQVKIDVIITEVSLSDKQVSGLSTFGLSYAKELDTATGRKGWYGETSTWSLSDSDSAAAFSLGLGENGFSAVFNVAEQNNRVKILSAPSITTTHNNLATINVSKRYPLLKGTTSYDGTSYPTTKSEIEWRDIGILLDVTPRIGDNGVVQMKIKQTVESVVDNVEIDGNKQPIIGKREAESFVSAMSDEIIVLAGLQQGISNDAAGEVWLLSDIPLLGNLFKPDRDNLERTELVIFIRPTIVKSRPIAQFERQNEITDGEVKADVNRYLKTGAFHDKNADPLKRGAHRQSSFFRTVYPLDDDSGAGDVEGGGAEGGIDDNGGSESGENSGANANAADGVGADANANGESSGSGAGGESAAGSVK